MDTETLKSSKTPGWVFVVLGIIQIILGIAAILAPFLAGTALVWVFGIIFLAASLFNLYQLFAVPHYKLWSLLSAIVYGILGFMFIWHTTAAMVGLTLFLGWVFVVGGIFRLLMSFKTKDGWQIFNGVITLVLGIVILVAMPEASFWVLGTLLGIELIFSGWTIATIGTLVNRINKQ